jgi:hypothetical protein
MNPVPAPRPAAGAPTRRSFAPAPPASLRMPLPRPAAPVRAGAGRRSASSPHCHGAPRRACAQKCAPEPILRCHCEWARSAAARPHTDPLLPTSFFSASRLAAPAAPRLLPRAMRGAWERALSSPRAPAPRIPPALWQPPSGPAHPRAPRPPRHRAPARMHPAHPSTDLPLPPACMRGAKQASPSTPAPARPPRLPVLPAARRAPCPDLPPRAARLGRPHHLTYVACAQATQSHAPSDPRSPAREHRPVHCCKGDPRPQRPPPAATRRAARPRRLCTHRLRARLAARRGALAGRAPSFLLACSVARGRHLAPHPVLLPRATRPLFALARTWRGRPSQRPTHPWGGPARRCALAPHLRRCASVAGAAVFGLACTPPCPPSPFRAARPHAPPTGCARRHPGPPRARRGAAGAPRRRPPQTNDAPRKRTARPSLSALPGPRGAARGRLPPSGGRRPGAATWRPQASLPLWARLPSARPTYIHPDPIS